MSNPNLPDNVKSLPWDKRQEPVNVTVELTSITYDDGYGEQCAELIIDCEVTGQEVKCSDGMVFMIDRDGGVYKEVEYEYNESNANKAIDEAIYNEALRLAGNIPR